MIDFHTQKASELFDVAPEDVTLGQRRVAKTWNHMQNYSAYEERCISASKLGFRSVLLVPMEEAERAFIGDAK